MLSKTLSDMSYFVGKVCTIISTSMNRSFDEQISREHFVIRVEAITSDGIWGSHPYNPDYVSFFFMKHVISIHQEVELSPDDPLVKEQEKKIGTKLQGDIKTVSTKEEKSTDLLPVINMETPIIEDDSEGDSPFIEIEKLEKLAEISKKTFDVKHQFENRMNF